MRGEFDLVTAKELLERAYFTLEEKRLKNSALSKYHEGIKSLSGRGISKIFGYAKKASELAQNIVKDLVVKKKQKRDDAKEGAEYAIASTFLNIYYARYSEKFIKDLVNNFKKTNFQEFFRDHTLVELQKIQLVSDSAALKYKHRASGIMALLAIIEKLDTYIMTVALFENENGVPSDKYEDGQENSREVDEE